MTVGEINKGAVNGEIFRNFVETKLAPVLGGGDVVIIDNLSSHKVSGVRELIEARGAKVLFPYSPNLNPIDRAWAQVKQLLRSLDPRTIGKVLRCIK